MPAQKVTHHSLTKTQVSKLKALCRIVNKKEKQAIAVAKRLFAQLRSHKNKRVVDDFNLYARFSVFSDNKVFNKKRGVEEGDPFWIDEAYVLPSVSDKKMDNYNWNEYSVEKSLHPLKKVFFSEAMHRLWFDSELPLADVFYIDHVWIEVKVDYQFMTRVKPKKASEK